MTTERRRISIRRAYDTDTGGDGYRVLVDRLWPRGVRKADAAIDEWLKDAAPTTELRRWYGHEVSRFDEFARRYPAADGRLYSGFVAKSADKIFESTDKR